MQLKAFFAAAHVAVMVTLLELISCTGLPATTSCQAVCSSVTGPCVLRTDSKLAKASKLFVLHLQPSPNLSQLIQEVPAVLTCTCKDDLGYLLATSRELRNQVHSFVTQIHIGQDQDILLLVSKDWPRLTRLCTGGTYYGTGQCTCRTWKRGSRSCSNQGLDASNLELLVTGSWPLLQFLNVSGISEGMAALQHGQWPLLNTLLMKDCQISGSIAHLTAAPWNQLQHLSLEGNALTTRDLVARSRSDWPNLRRLSLESEVYHLEGYHLVGNVLERFQMQISAAEKSGVLKGFNKAQWPELIHLDAYAFGLHSFNMAWLTQGAWPQLKTIDLSGEPLHPTSCMLLSKGHWPLLQMLSVGKTLLGRLGGLHHLLSAEWPAFKCLDLCCNGLRGSDTAQVATGRWPLLEKLCLHDNHLDVVGISALVKADWPLLKVLDVSCQGVYSDIVGILTQSEVWPCLECVEVAHNMHDWLHMLVGPDHGSKLTQGVNEIHNPEVVARGQWPKLKQLIFSDPNVPSLCCWSC